MAHAHDAVAQGENPSGSSLTVPHTCTGSNRILTVGVGTYNASGGPATVTVTYNSVSMTEIVNVTFDGGDGRLTKFYLVAPATGANNIVVTASKSTEIVLVSSSYTGSHQSTFTGDDDVLSGSSTTPNIDAPLVSGSDELCVSVVACYDPSTIAADSPLTERVENNNGSSLNSIAIGDRVGVASTDTDWTLGQSAAWGVCSKAFLESAGTVFTGTAAITAGSAVVAASGTFTPPTYTGSAALVAGSPVLAASGTFTAPVFTGSTSLVAGSPVLAASGTFTAPIYTGSAVLTAGSPVLAASGTFTAPIYTGSAALVAGAPVLAASGTFSTVSFTGSAALVAGSPVLAASGTFTTPIYTGSAALVAGLSLVAASGTHVAPTWTGSATMVAGSSVLAASGTFSVNTFTGSAALVAGSPVLASSGTFTSPIYTGSAALVAGSPVLVASGTFTAVGTFTGSAALVAGSPVLVASGTFTSPIYTGSATLVAGSAIVAASGTFAVGTFTGSAALVAGSPVLASSGTFTSPIYTGSASLSAGSPVLAATGVFTAPVFTGSASLVAGSPVIVASGLYNTAGVFLGSATLVAGSPTVQATGTFTSAFDDILLEVGVITFEELPGPGVDFLNLADAIAAASLGNILRTQRPWINPDPSPLPLINKNITIEAIGLAATQGFVNESSGTYWRSINTDGSKWAAEVVANGVILRGLTFKVDHSNNDFGAIRAREVITVESCVLYGRQFSSAQGQHGVSFPPGTTTLINSEISNTLIFNMRGSGIITETGGMPTFMEGLVRIRGTSIYRCLAGVEREGTGSINEIGYYLHSVNFGFCQGLGAEATSIKATGFHGRWYVENCISDDTTIINPLFDANTNCLGSQQVQVSPFSTGQIVVNRDFYPYDWRPEPADLGGNNVLVDHHAEMTKVHIFPIFNTLLDTALNGALRETTAVDCGAFELVTTAIGTIDTEFPFFEQDISASAGVVTGNVDTIAPFFENDLISFVPVVGQTIQEFPFMEQDAAGTLPVIGTGNMNFPFIEQDVVGLADLDVAGDVDTTFPFIDQDIEGQGRRVTNIDTIAPFIDLQASSQSIAQGDLVEDFPFIDQDAAGSVQTITQIIQDLPFIDLTGSGEVEVNGLIVQDLPFIELELASTERKMVGLIASTVPFLELDLVSTAATLGDLNMEFPFLDFEQGPGAVTMEFPPFIQQAEGVAAIAEGDVDMEFPFVEIDLVGGLNPPRIGGIDMLFPPFLQCGECRVLHDSNIDSFFPFLDIAALGAITIQGTASQDLPFIDLTAKGRTADAQYCLREAIFTATLRVADLIPERRSLEVIPVVRELEFVCRSYDPDASDSVTIKWQTLEGGLVTSIAGGFIELEG